MSPFKQRIYDILKGNFLISNDSFKNWQFILFIAILMLFMISSSHSIDQKVMRIAQINKEIQELRSEFVDMRSISMKIRLESTIRNKVAPLGIKPSENPPQVIRVTTKNK
jgi:hypothetical protein